MVNYRKFFEEDQANDLAERLRDSGIVSEVIHSQSDLNFIYGDKHFQNQYIVNLRQEDFERADAVLLQTTRVDLREIDKDHYLFAFSDDELFNILSKPDEWHESDYQLASRILNQRGKDISPAAIALLKAQRIASLAKPEESNRTWIFAGYFFACLGGVLGIFIGYSLLSYKKTLPNGERVFGYSATDRRHGARIFFLGLLFFILHTVFFYFDVTTLRWRYRE